jgi:Flp pilus assembly protein TadG
MTMQQLIARIVRCRRGAAALEFGLALPFLLTLFAGLFDFGSSVMNAMALEAAARVGAQYALTQPTDTAGIAAAVSAGTHLDASTLTISSSSWCECPDGTTVDCTSGTCGTNVVLLRFVTVQVTQPFTSLLPYPAFIRPTQLSGAAVMRVT